MTNERMDFPSSLWELRTRITSRKSRPFGKVAERLGDGFAARPVERVTIRVGLVETARRDISASLYVSPQERAIVRHIAHVL